MSAGPLVDVVNFLAGVTALGLTIDNNLYASLLPDDPDDVVAVIEYPGAEPVWVMGSVLPGIEDYSMQIVSRMDEFHYTDNDARIQAIYRVVAAVVDQTINGTNYLWWEPLHAPAFLHRDEKRRIHHVLNIAVMRQPN